MKGIVDRIEGDYIVVEIEESMYNLDKRLVVGEVCEGDTVDVSFDDEGEMVSIVKNEQESKDREAYIQDLVKDMWE